MTLSYSRCLLQTLSTSDSCLCRHTFTNVCTRLTARSSTAGHTPKHSHPLALVRHRHHHRSFLLFLLSHLHTPSKARHTLTFVRPKPRSPCLTPNHGSRHPLCTDPDLCLRLSRLHLLVNNLWPALLTPHHSSQMGAQTPHHRP